MAVDDYPSGLINSTAVFLEPLRDLLGRSIRKANRLAGSTSQPAPFNAPVIGLGWINTDYTLVAILGPLRTCELLLFLEARGRACDINGWILLVDRLLVSLSPGLV